MAVIVLRRVAAFASSFNPSSSEPGLAQQQSLRLPQPVFHLRIALLVAVGLPQRLDFRRRSRDVALLQINQRGHVARRRLVGAAVVVDDLQRLGPVAFGQVQAEPRQPVPEAVRLRLRLDRRAPRRNGRRASATPAGFPGDGKTAQSSAGLTFISLWYARSNSMAWAERSLVLSQRPSRVARWACMWKACGMPGDDLM